MLRPCVDPNCGHRRSEVVKTYIRYPAWLQGPDPIIEHCECGHHNRVWTTNALLEAWRKRP